MKKSIKKTIKNTKKVEKEKYVTLDIFNKAMKNIDARFVSVDKKFDDFASAILKGVEEIIKEQTLRMEALFEDKKDKDKIYFKDGLNTQNFKIKDLEKRVEKIEKRVF